jgi:hypothetical protein
VWCFRSSTRPARAYERLVADHVAAPAVPVARRRGLAPRGHRDGVAGGGRGGGCRGGGGRRGTVARATRGRGTRAAETGERWGRRGQLGRRCLVGGAEHHHHPAVLWEPVVQLRQRAACQFASLEMVEVRLLFTQMPKCWGRLFLAPATARGAVAETLAPTAAISSLSPAAGLPPPDPLPGAAPARANTVPPPGP